MGSTGNGASQLASRSVLNDFTGDVWITSAAFRLALFECQVGRLTANLNCIYIQNVNCDACKAVETLVKPNQLRCFPRGPPFCRNN